MSILRSPTAVFALLTSTFFARAGSLLLTLLLLATRYVNNQSLNSYEEEVKLLRYLAGTDEDLMGYTANPIPRLSERPSVLART